MGTPKPTCLRCGGDGIDPSMADEDFEPTYEALVNNDPMPCKACDGHGVEDPYDGDGWMMRNL